MYLICNIKLGFLLISIYISVEVPHKAHPIVAIYGVAMKKAFLKPFALTVGALLSVSIGSEANASTNPIQTEFAAGSVNDTNKLTAGTENSELIIQQPATTQVKLAGHYSHTSHASHASHCSSAGTVCPP